MQKTDITIIGGGVVGLAIAREIAGKFGDVFLVERHDSFGQEQSSRNSEVIHSSIYYPQNYLKGQLCLRGNDLIYEIGKKYNVPLVNCGKLIVANSPEDEAALPELLETAKNNGAKGVRIVDAGEIARIEPKVRADAAIWCPASGVVDSHALMQYYEAHAIDQGANIVYGMNVYAIEKKQDSYLIVVQDKKGEESRFETRYLINAAGIGAGEIAHKVGIDQDEAGYRIHWHKGVYYRVMHGIEEMPKALIYPVPPESGSVGIHTCPDLAGGMRLGPHFYWSDELNYDVDDRYREVFFEQASRYLPTLKNSDMRPDMSGIMAAVQKPGESMKDFIIRHEEDKGFSNLINLVGMESPALTSSPAIAEVVRGILDEIA
jgi:L-2-hydroxyglutarate oxidase LhgO